MEVSSQLHTPTALPPGKEPPVPIGQEAGWAPGLVWTLWRGEKSCLVGNGIWAIWPTASHYPNTNILFHFFPMALPGHSGPRPLIQFCNHFSKRVGLLRWVISLLQGYYLNTGQHKHRLNAYTHQTSMP
jgi:hypothetical protein